MTDWGGRQIFFLHFVLTLHIYWAWGGYLIEGVCNSSLTFLPLSSLTFNGEGSGSFSSNHFDSLTTWFDFFWSVIAIFCSFI